MQNKLKILIVEDDAIIAQLIEHHLIDFGYHVLDIVHNSERALDKIHTLQPDLVLLDINILGTKDGIQIAHIMEEKYTIPYIFLTALSDRSTLGRAQELSPLAYIVKPFKESDLQAAIVIGMSNYKKTSQEETITIEAVNKICHSPLSDKEFEILLKAAKGFSNQQVANEMKVSINTVKWHTQNIYSKLGVKNRTAAAQLVMSL